MEAKYIGFAGKMVHKSDSESAPSREVKLEDHIRRVSSRGPEMFARLVLAFRKEFGDKALDVASKVMYERGIETGRAQALKAENLGLKEYFRVHVLEGLLESPATDVALDELSDASLIYHCPPGECPLRIPMVWHEMGLDDETIKMLGRIYCGVQDSANREGFNPEIQFDMKQCQSQGDPICEMCHTIGGQ